MQSRHIGSGVMRGGHISSESSRRILKPPPVPDSAHAKPYRLCHTPGPTTQARDEITRLRRQLAEAQSQSRSEFLDLEQQLAEAERARVAAASELEAARAASEAEQQRLEEQVGKGGLMGAGCLLCVGGGGEQVSSSGCRSRWDGGVCSRMCCVCV